MTYESLSFRILKFIATYITALPILILGTPFFRLYEYLTLSPASARPNSPEIHRRKVEDVQAQVRNWNKRGRPNRMCTARKAWKTLSVHNMSKDAYTQIAIDMEDVVEIDTERRVLTVEPGMMMGKLTAILLPMGWTIPVVPEFETLTVGGVTCGGGLETSSHKHGFVADTLLAIEIVLASGEVVECSRDENPDLFYAIPWSHGTLGFVTAVKVPLIPAKRYVKLEYRSTKSCHEAGQLLQRADHEFVEGIQYGPEKFVIMYGDQVGEDGVPQGGRVNHINRWYKPWFYKHVERFFDHRGGGGGGTKANTIEYLPLRDYYHRHTRSYFWETGAVFPYGNAPLFRWLLGWLYPINFQLAKLLLPSSFYDTYFVMNHMLQDFIIPLAHLEASSEFLHNNFEIYPIWLCPCKFLKRPGMLQCVGPDAELYVDIGIYGTVPNSKKEEYDPERSTRLVERFAREHTGIQGLYADSYMTRAEFGEMFDMKLYDEMRARYGCEGAFPHVYDKVSKAARQITA